MKVLLKVHSLGITIDNYNYNPRVSKKTLDNCVIKHLLKVPCAGFVQNCEQTRTLSNTPFNMTGNHFLAHGTEKGFTSVLMHFSSF